MRMRLVSADVDFNLFQNARSSGLTPAQASPMDMAPKHSGDTLTPAVLERIRYRPSSVGGSGAGAKRSLMVAAELCDEERESEVRRKENTEGPRNATNSGTKTY
jgi:hypothetical protein